MASFKAPSLLPSRKKTPESKSAINQLEVEERKALEPSAVEVSDAGQVQGSVDGEVVGDRIKEIETDPLEEDYASGGSTVEEVAKNSSKHSQQKKSSSVECVVPGVAPSPGLPYTEPHWSGVPSHHYYLTVIKSGSIIEEIDISSKPFQVFGRLPVCDVSLDHPSISRYHAVLQYRPADAANVSTDVEGGTLSAGGPNEAGFYVYDLNSTHGSFLNKSKLQPRVYYRVRVGQMVRFGGSSRLFVLEVGSSDSAAGQELVEAEAQAEIRQLQREKEVWLTRQREREEERERLAKEREEMGATWGMVMDEIQHRENDEEELTIDPEREAYYKDDPKKALKKFFDREGLELDYEVEEEGTGRDKTYVARVTLPIESGGGEMLVVEESVQGKKKEAVVQCALKACRILDSNDMLRAVSKRRQRLSKNWEENDYYDSDEDTFLDRTGELERKRRQRMKRLGKLQEHAESYDTLEKRLEEVGQQKQSIETRLSKAQRVQVGGAGDSLDEYMSVVSSRLDPATITRLKQQVQELGKEEESIRKLLRIAKPAEMPSVKSSIDGPREGAVPEVSRLDDTPTTGPATLRPSSVAAHPPDDYTTTAPRARRRKKRSSSSGGSGPVSVEGNKDKGGGGEEQGEGGEVPSKKRPRVMGPALPPQLRRDMPEQKEVVSGEADPEFASWLPPEDQTGDGRTYLNDKYGY